jgi:hypothetical protein
MRASLRAQEQMARGVGAGVELNRLASAVVMEIDQSMIRGLAWGGGRQPRLRLGAIAATLATSTAGRPSRVCLNRVDRPEEKELQGSNSSPERIPVHPPSHGPVFQTPSFKVPPNATSLSTSRGVPGDATRYMICFVSCELKIFVRSGAVSVPCHAAPTGYTLQHGVWTWHFSNNESPRSSPADVRPLRRHLAHGLVILGPVGVTWLRS